MCSHVLRESAAVRSRMRRDGVFEAQRIPQFERPERVGVAPAHGAVDLHDAIGNLRHHAGGVEHQVAEQLPQERAGAVGAATSMRSRSRQVLDIAARLPPKRSAASRPDDTPASSSRAPDLPVSCRRVCRSPGRAYRPAIRASIISSQKRRQHEALAPRIVRPPCRTDCWSRCAQTSRPTMSSSR